MTLRTYAISHGQKDGFALILEERSLFREVVGNWADDVAHAILPESWAWDACQAISQWQDNKVRVLDRILIEEESAVALSSPGVWDFLTED